MFSPHEFLLKTELKDVHPLVASKWFHEQPGTAVKSANGLNSCYAGALQMKLISSSIQQYLISVPEPFGGVA